MNVLKTVVATAVIVFTVTTVAMAGVNHLTKQNGQSSRAQAQTATTTTITLTAGQFAQLVRGQNGAGTTKARRHTQRVQGQRQAGRQSRSQTGSGSSCTRGSTGYSQQGNGDAYRCFDYDDHHANGGSGGASGNGYHSNGGHDGGCW